MSYLVLARKFRPQTFSEVVGQEHVVRTLKNAVSSGRVSHAYLFTGTRGVGKTSIARIFAKALNCQHAVNGEPCNKCDSCKDIAEGRHLDVIEIDGASNRGIDDIRNLREKVNYAPSGGGVKVYIIDEVHQITRDAFNALLKTLEEPPPSVIFIFATTEPKKLPDTILSRVQRFDFKRIPLEKIEEQLLQIAKHENIKIDEEALYLIALKADGSMRDAQSFLDQLISYSSSGTIDSEDARVILGMLPSEVYIELMNIIAEGNKGEIFNYVMKLQNQGFDFYDFALEFLVFLRNILMFKNAPDYKEIKLLPTETQKHLSSISKRFSTGDLSRLFALAESLETKLRNAVFPRITVETTLLRMAALISTVELESIIESLKTGLLPSDKSNFPENIAPVNAAKKTKQDNSSRVNQSILEKRKDINLKPTHLNKKTLIEKWQSFCESLGEKDPYLGGLLHDANVVEMKEGHVYIAVKDAILKGISGDNHTETIEKELLEFFGIKIKAVFVKLPNGKERTIKKNLRLSPTMDPRHPEAKKKEALKRIQGYPSLKKLVDTFDAEIVDL